MRLFRPQNKSYQLVTIIFALLFTTSSALANIGDWAMVQQFNKKLAMANEGKIQAMYDVGNLYMRGRGVNRNLNEAAKWFKKAASTGHASSQARLGILYFEGRGVKQDYSQALKLLNAAAKQKIPSAYYQLANMYELGTGVRQDLHKSIAWYKKAEQSGYYLAKAKIERLSKRLVNGTVTPSNKANSVAPVMNTLLRGRWLKRKTAVGYLPSNIANCAKDSANTFHCISTSQERSTGTEVITFNTESLVTVKNNKRFDVSYSNNVLDIELQDTIDGNGQRVTTSSSRIKKGKQGRKRQLSCVLKNSKTISCTKGASTFNLVSQ